MTTRKRTAPGNGRRRTPPQKAKPKPRLRLIKVYVQPVLILDDGETIEDVKSSVAEITAADWPTWAAKAYAPEGLADLQKQLQADGAGEDE